jgi:hypothetical protein
MGQLSTLTSSQFNHFVEEEVKKLQEIKSLEPNNKCINLLKKMQRFFFFTGVLLTECFLQLNLVGKEEQINKNLEVLQKIDSLRQGYFQSMMINLKQ